MLTSHRIEARSIDHALRREGARGVDARYRDRDLRPVDQAADLSRRGGESPCGRAGEAGEVVAGIVGDGGRIDFDVVSGGIAEIGAQIDGEGGPAQVGAEVGRRVGHVELLDQRIACGLPDADEAGVEDDGFVKVDDQVIGGRVLGESVDGTQCGDGGAGHVGDD